MNNIRRFFNQNRGEIIKIAVIIAFALIILQLVNFWTKKKNEEELLKITESTNTTSQENNTEKNGTLVSDKSAISGKTVSTENLNNATEVIEQFITYCNEKEIEKAYNLLTSECKNEIYKTLEIFTKAYYEDVFGGTKKTYTVENWTGDVYKVRISDDKLITGNSNDGKAKQDYITIKNENGETKININNFIGYSKINKTTTQDNLTMEVVGKNRYKDYEEYIIKIANKTEYSIQLDDVSSSKTLYIEDSKGNKYSYNNNELTNPEITIAQGQTKEVKIKFYSSYVSTKEIKYMVFSNMTAIDDDLISREMEFKINL